MNHPTAGRRLIDVKTRSSFFDGSWIRKNSGVRNLMQLPAAFTRDARSMTRDVNE